jgi:hypothetical protein
MNMSEISIIIKGIDNAYLILVNLAPEKIAIAVIGTKFGG